ncbi:MAG: hypothetical protein ABIK93_02765 [candidate division WOR-3 bacterium]
MIEVIKKEEFGQFSQRRYKRNILFILPKQNKKRGTSPLNDLYEMAAN